jgi:hypothetical protein
MLTDAGTPTAVTGSLEAPAAGLVNALAVLEGLIGATNVGGFIHAGIQWAPVAAYALQLVRSGNQLKTPTGSIWAFGSGYVGALDNTLVATSVPYGWRNDPESRVYDTPDAGPFQDRTVVVERSVVIAFEKVLGAATITTT